MMRAAERGRQWGVGEAAVAMDEHQFQHPDAEDAEVSQRAQKKSTKRKTSHGCSFASSA
jgi:hypothetical protein